MGRGTPLSCLGPACCLLLLLGDYGALGSRGKQRGPLEERQSAVTEAAPWGRGRYEAVKKQLGAVGALSKQYWQYLACKVWQEGCEKEEEEKTSRGPGKLLPLSCLGNSSGVCTTSSHGLCGEGLPIAQHALCWGGKCAHAHPGSVPCAPDCHGTSCSSSSLSPSASLHLGRVAVRQLTWQHLRACAQCKNAVCLCSDLSRLELASGGPGLPGDPLCLVLQFWQVLQDRRLPDHQQHHRWVLQSPLLLSFF